MSLPTWNRTRTSTIGRFGVFRYTSRMKQAIIMKRHLNRPRFTVNDKTGGYYPALFKWKEICYLAPVFHFTGS